MRCHQCGRETAGTETSPGSVSSICVGCNTSLTGVGHHEDAYDVHNDGTRIVDCVDPLDAEKAKAARKPTAKPPTRRPPAIDKGATVDVG